MTNNVADASWMRPALDLLYSELSREQALALLQDAPSRNELLNGMRTKFELLEPPYVVPEGDIADNLLQGLIAIRTKFDQEEGRAKVEMNIAMRSRGR
jgi:hypothetical protein